MTRPTWTMHDKIMQGCKSHHMHFKLSFTQSKLTVNEKYTDKQKMDLPLYHLKTKPVSMYLYKI